MKVGKKMEKYRNYFITINEGAKCYNNIDEILASISNTCDYAYIYHNDIEEVKDIDEFKEMIENGEELKQHIHLVIKFYNQRNFNAVMKMFEGAHIEVSKSIVASCRYLCHLDNTDKKKYDIRDVIQHNNLFDRYYASGEIFSYESIYNNINRGIINDYNDVLKIYGVDQVQRFRSTIKDIFDMFNFEGDCLGKMRRHNSDLQTISDLTDTIVKLKEEICILQNEAKVYGFIKN